MFIFSRNEALYIFQKTSALQKDKMESIRLRSDILKKNSQNFQNI